MHAKGIAKQNASNKQSNNVKKLSESASLYAWGSQKNKTTRRTQ